MHVIEGPCFLPLLMAMLGTFQSSLMEHWLWQFAAACNPTIRSRMEHALAQKAKTSIQRELAGASLEHMPLSNCK